MRHEILIFYRLFSIKALCDEIFNDNARFDIKQSLENENISFSFRNISNIFSESIIHRHHFTDISARYDQFLNSIV